VLEFTKEGMDLLNHGFQHSMERSLKPYWINLIVETERAIKLLDTKLIALWLPVSWKKPSIQTTNTTPYKTDNYVLQKS